MGPGDPGRRPQNGTRTRVEARITFLGTDEDAEEIAAPTRKFAAFEITSGLPDDSREADEREEARRLRERRARVKVARAVVATTPGLAETPAAEWQRAARFYARFGITEAIYLHRARAGRGGRAAARGLLRGRRNRVTNPGIK